MSYSLVAIQFTMLIAVAVSGPIVASGFWLILEVAAILLAIWAILTMRLGNFNVTPQPKKDANLVQVAPYSWIRHPMYLSLILGAAALVANSFSWLRLFFWLVLIVDLVVKLNVEEQLLIRHFAGYEQLRQHSWRLIPYVY
ncbi:MAG: isoprenylcysteine carboxylmethyltransferase family protein [Caldilineaceae bacterium]